MMSDGADPTITVNSDGSVSPASDLGRLAEFTALRQELQSLSAAYHNTFVLQLAAAGAVFSFVLVDSQRTLFVLILPIVTYILCVRASIHRCGIDDIARYIREELSPSVSGGLHYEAWYLTNSSVPRISTLTHPAFFAFPGIALVGLAWALPATVDLWPASKLEFAGLGVIWLIGLVLTGVCIKLVRRAIHTFYRTRKH